MNRYFMVVDVDRCVGCNACVVACKASHNSPNSVLCTSVIEKEVGHYPHSARHFVPVLCNHCQRAVCVDVCPSGATYCDDDGVVLVSWDKCIGCKACIEACPYDARHTTKNAQISFPGGEPFVNPTLAQPPARVPIKCDFCAHLREQDQLPACVSICPTRARIFGDREQDTALAQQAAQQGWTLLPDKGTEPQVFYFGLIDEQ